MTHCGMFQVMKFTSMKHEKVCPDQFQSDSCELLLN